MAVEEPLEEAVGGTNVAVEEPLALVVGEEEAVAEGVKAVHFKPPTLFPVKLLARRMQLPVAGAGPRDALAISSCGRQPGSSYPLSTINPDDVGLSNAA